MHQPNVLCLRTLGKCQKSCTYLQIFPNCTEPFEPWLLPRHSILDANQIGVNLYSKPIWSDKGMSGVFENVKTRERENGRTVLRQTPLLRMISHVDYLADASCESKVKRSRSKESWVNNCPDPFVTDGFALWICLNVLTVNLTVAKTSRPVKQIIRINRIFSRYMGIVVLWYAACKVF